MTTQTLSEKKEWQFDADHSEMGFKVKHMMIANVSGTFENINVHVKTLGDDFSTAEISFTADINSINTGSAKRDEHLKSADFFDAENHPVLSFQSTSMERIDHENYHLKGHFKIRDIEHPVTLRAEFGGIAKDPWGNEKVGFSITGKINRTDWGLNWNAALEAGGVLVGEEIKLHAEIQLSSPA
ncbi:MAG: YceI family protein [Flavobacteriales bacterium]|nr:YceI family protein [Flavobacteriales bacterium]